MDREQYDAFVEALINAETAPVHGFEENMVFEGCMPVESMAKRGHMVLAFGPLKPVGLIDPKTGRESFAVVQLRQDDASASLYNIVGFQTRLKFPEQRRVFGMIPGLENAEFARYGVMHRNTFLQSPGFLDDNYRMISRPDIFFAGQMTGVEGYVESTASGLAAGIALARQLQGKDRITFPTTTAIGALARYVSTPNGNYQPMNITFGLIDPLEKRVRKKMDRYDEISKRAIEDLRKWCTDNDN
jgi:methylenetetrahydrofolate--tRNA-(uracil-5-)-methyltransferase